MANPVFARLNPLLKLLVYIMIAIGCMGIFGILGGIFFSFFSDLSLEEITSLSSSARIEYSMHFLFFNSWVVHFGLFLIPALLFFKIFGKRSVDGFWFKKIGWKLLLIPVIMLVAMPAIELLIQFNQWIIPEGSYLESLFKPAEDNLEELTSSLLNMENWGQYLRNVLFVALIPAFTEELAFRGVIQSQVAKHTSRIHLAIWFSAFIFSFIHMQFYGFLPRMVLGAFFGYLLIWTGSIWAPILAHFINNLVGVSLEFYVQHNEEITEKENIEDAIGSNLIYIIPSLVVLFLTLRFLRNTKIWEKIKPTYYYSESDEPSLPVDQG